MVIGRLRAEPASTVAERLRRAIETMPGLPVTITASVGVTLFKASRPLPTYHDVLHASDTAIYRPKHLGGNTAAIDELSETARTQLN